MEFERVLPLFLSFIVLGVYHTVEFHRGMGSSDDEVRGRLRELWCGVPEKGFAAYAYHLAPEPNRSRLRRSAWASILGLSLLAVGAAMMGFWMIGLLAIAFETYHLLLLLRPATTRQ